MARARSGMVNGGGNAPTSPTLRELFCAAAQSGSRDEILVLHDAPGYPRRGLKPSLEHFAAVGMIAGKIRCLIENMRLTKCTTPVEHGRCF